MNIGTILDELGLDALSPGGPDDPDAGPQEPLDDEDEEEDVSEEKETRESSSSGGLFGGGDDGSSELTDDIADLEHELSGVRNQVEQNSASIDGLESEQVNVGERLDRIEEHNATLLGVYDHLTESVNPFTGDWEGDIEQPDESESKFGVIPGPEDETENEDAWDTETEETDPGQSSERSPEPEPTFEPASEQPVRTTATEPTSTSTRPPNTDDGPYLTRFAATYATEVLLMEWLTMLVDRSGQEGALKALDHYDRIDWISEPVKRDLEVMLSGAHCDPDTPPQNDLNTDVHDRSFKYIARLSQQAQLEQSEQMR